MITIIAVFLACFGVFCLVMSAMHPHADAAVPGLIAGVVCLVFAAVSTWGSLHWR